MQAVQQFKNGKYSEALQFIVSARNWPEILGVGKPYEQDVDERLEDWMTYRSYLQMGNKTEAQGFLEKILRFEPKVENTVKNFIPANHLVTAWAIKKTTTGKEQAASWLNKQFGYYPGDKSLLWVKAVFQNHKNELSENEKDASMRVLQQLEGLK